MTRVLQDARSGRAGSLEHGLFDRGRRFSTPILGLLTAACASGEGGSGWRGSIDTLPNGAVLVRNESGQFWDSSTGWRLVEVARIGNADGEGPAAFAQIAAVETDDRGRIYVLESQAQEIRVFDSAGAHVRTIGRKGAGPGEFRQAIGMAWDPRGRLWVVDQQNVRYTLLDTAGVLVTTRPRRISGWFTWRWEGGIDRAGNVYEWYRPSGEMGGDRLLRYDSTLQSTDTLPLPSHEGEIFKLERESMRAIATVAFTPTLSWTFDPRGYVWFGLTAPYRIYRRELAGDTGLVIERAYEPLPVSSTERDSAVAAYEWFTAQGGKVDASRIPSRKPAFERFVVDDRGSVWVMPIMPGDAARRVFDVFDEGGRYLGEVRASFAIASGAPLLIRGDRLLTITTDADGVPFVVRARIER
ncbi:MAG: 6-bladed beta-propeller [Gemmatimonadales bacterium]|nr:6-bladed beta-propeller [Gemmatimonadales bacterium]